MLHKLANHLFFQGVVVIVGLLLLAGCSDGPETKDPASQTATQETQQPLESGGEAKANPVLPPSSLTYRAGANGTLSGTTDQQLAAGETGTAVTAVADAGYHFAGWNDGHAAAERVDRATGTNLEVTANFSRNRYTLRYEAEGGGTIEGQSTQSVEHGGSGQAVVATPGPHRHFLGWSDGGKTAERIDSDLDGDLTLTARFAVDQYTLHYSAVDNGSIAGPATQRVNHGESGTAVTAVPADGYRFVQWSDGDTNAGRTDRNLTGNLTLTAIFSLNQYRAVYGAEAHGRIEGEAEQLVKHGDATAPVTAVAEAGHHFVAWSDGVDTAQRKDENLTKALKVTARFAADTYRIGGRVSGLIEGTHLVLQNNGEDTLDLAANGEFFFPVELLDRQPYAVTVQAQPQAPNQICSISAAAAGTVAAAHVDDIQITCVLATYTVGGTVSGLPAGDEIVLRNNQSESLPLNTNGSFVFKKPLKDGSAFAIEVQQQPKKTNWTCDLRHADGVLNGADITDIEVDCYLQAVLQAEAGTGRVRLDWNAAEFSGVSFELCLAHDEFTSADFERCAQLPGGNLKPKVTSPLLIESLENNRTYRFQLLARYENGRKTYSKPVEATPFGGLNDSGIDWCADASGHRNSGGTRGAKLAGCEALATSFPAQDALQGRDAKVGSREIKKSGSGASGFDFTKLCRSGDAAGEAKCPPNPLPGTGFDHWGCVRDNVTGLVWEIKSPGGVRAKEHTYSWHQPNESLNGGDPGMVNGGTCEGGSGCDTAAYVSAVNKEELCGMKDWRLPTRRELLSIVDNGRFNPAIDTQLFPDTLAEYYWTSSPYADQTTDAWQVHFLYGEALPAKKSQPKPVRLVHGRTATFGMGNP